MFFLIYCDIIWLLARLPTNSWPTTLLEEVWTKSFVMITIVTIAVLISLDCWKMQIQIFNNCSPGFHFWQQNEREKKIFPSWEDVKEAISSFKKNHFILLEEFNKLREKKYLRRTFSFCFKMSFFFIYVDHFNDSVLMIWEFYAVLI